MTAPTPNPLHPSPALLAKLGSAIVHADEVFGPAPNLADVAAFNAARHDPDVQEWIKAMTALAMLPVKR